MHKSQTAKIPSEAINSIKKIVGKENLKMDLLERTLYSYDASLARAMPCGVIHFTDIEQIAPVIKILYKHSISYSPRAAGTNLSGGTINLKGKFILNLARLDKIHQIDTFNRIAVVEPGVVNFKLQEKLSEFGFFYAPDPASQKVSTIGGNIAENAGGPQCLKYGVTSNNIVKLEIVLPDGTEKIFSVYDGGPELLSIFPQSEGTLGIVKKAWLRILPIPKFIKTISASFNSIEDSIIAVTKIIAQGIIPRTLEEMDKLSIQAAKSDIGIDIPNEIEAILLIELDSDEENEIENNYKKTIEILKENKATKIEIAKTEAEREMLWKLRKEAYPALARMAPNVMVEDGAVPRPKLPQVLKEVKEILSSYKLKAGILFHAGDGNIHPNIIFDERDIEETKRVKKAGQEILKACIKAGGTISGEHGIGVEKRAAMNWLYSNETLEIFRKLKAAIDEKNLSNPDKKIPLPHNQISCINKEAIKLSEEAQKILKEIKQRNISKEKSAIVGTGSKNKNIPQNCKILKTTTLNKILDLDIENFTVKVESGVEVSKLKKILEEQNLTIEIPSFVNGSVGGMVASKEFVEIRNLITGMELILSNGNLITLGGKTMKDVSGYDIPRLMIGSCGCLAFILSVTLKIKRKTFSNFTKFENKFKPDDFTKKIKKIFDPENLFNPWIIEI